MAKYPQSSLSAIGKKEVYSLLRFMEVLKLSAKTDESGCLHLQIPTQLATAEVNVVIVLNPVLPVEKPRVKYDFSDLVGKLTWQGDAVAMQRSLRDEW